MVEKGKWTRKRDNMFRLVLVVFSLVFTGGRMCSNRCCAGFHFNSTGHCVVCPHGSFGKNCTGSCPPGFYGELCSFKCQCNMDNCNSTFGCMSTSNSSNTSENLNYLNPITLTVAIPTTLGLLCLFCLIFTLLVIKMRKNTQEIPDASAQTYVLDVTMPHQANSCYDNLEPIEDLPPPPYNKDYTDDSLAINFYDTC